MDLSSLRKLTNEQLEFEICLMTYHRMFIYTVTGDGLLPGQKES